MSAFSSLRLKITLKHLKKFSREESYPHIHQGPSRNLINNEMRKDNFKNSNNEPEKESVISNLTNFTKIFFKNLQKTNQQINEDIIKPKKENFQRNVKIANNSSNTKIQENTEIQNSINNILSRPLKDKFNENKNVQGAKS